VPKTLRVMRVMGFCSLSEVSSDVDVSLSANGEPSGPRFRMQRCDADDEMVTR
jgi:hypothetical protein